MVKEIIKLFCGMALFAASIIGLSSCGSNQNTSFDINNQYTINNIEDMSLWNSILTKINANEASADTPILEVNLTSVPELSSKRKTNSAMLNTDSYEEYSTIETEIENVKDLLTEEELLTLQNAYETREKWLNEDYIFEDESTGVLFISGVDEDFTTQENWIDFSIRQVKIWKWYLPIGYDFKINNVGLGYSLLTVAFGVRITKIVSDFKHLIKASINPKYLNSTNQSVRELAQEIQSSRELVGDVIASLYGARVVLTTIADAICECKIPMWMFDYMGTAYQALLGLLKFSWFNFAFMILQTMLPTISDATKMINGLINSKTPTLHYTLCVYKGYSLS
jgi:hypothetical protein